MNVQICVPSDVFAAVKEPHQSYSVASLTLSNQTTWIEFNQSLLSLLEKHFFNVSRGIQIKKARFKDADSTPTQYVIGLDATSIKHIVIGKLYYKFLISSR